MQNRSHNYKAVVVILLFLCSRAALVAQVIDCRVQISSLPQLSSALDRGLTDEMARSITQLLNETAWTKEEYQPQERIQCELSLSITSIPSRNTYKASAQWLLLRPVYASDYQSILLSYTDRDWQFNYLSGQPLRYMEMGRLNEITGLLAFYAYLMLGLDADSFEDNSGTPYFQRAKEITTLVPSAGTGSWSQFGDLRNRYWLVDNLLDPQFLSIRQISYRYHRHGLDLMSQNVNEARAHIFSQLKLLFEKLQNTPPSALGTQWLDSKHSELISIFSKGPRQQRSKVYEMLKRIDPSRTEKYEKILQEK